MTHKSKVPETQNTSTLLALSALSQRAYHRHRYIYIYYMLYVCAYTTQHTSKEIEYSEYKCGNSVVQRILKIVKSTRSESAYTYKLDLVFKLHTHGCFYFDCFVFRVVQVIINVFRRQIQKHILMGSVLMVIVCVCVCADSKVQIYIVHICLLARSLASPLTRSLPLKSI